jgi:hypothetical protein
LLERFNTMDNKTKMLVIYRMASQESYERATSFETFLAVSQALESIGLIDFACLAMTVAHCHLELAEREAA